jgi:predicted acylesterase/phospholipase RssA
LFPPMVLDHLRASATSAEHPTPRNDENLELYPLPIDDLPIVVAVRMSLSFPGLFTAVPLWAVDYTLRRNQHLPPSVPATAERCWFSDGGISSNFPIHFFDAALPRWPTFGLSLKSPHPDFPDEQDFVWLPSTNGSGIQPRWNRFDQGSASRQVGGFVGAIIDSMQNWRDNLESRMPGYRNRIAHISQRPDEGGLNLSMPPEVIDRLSQRGRRAGTILRSQFDFDNHVWVRYRSYVAALVESLRTFARAYVAPVPQDLHAWEWVKGTAPPPAFPSYPLEMEHARDLATTTADGVAAIGRLPEGFDEGAPRPRPELRTAPRA